jgi:hypothetical protein
VPELLLGNAKSPFPYLNSPFSRCKSPFLPVNLPPLGGNSRPKAAKTSRRLT